MQIHIVKKGDTLWKISRSYGVSFEELKKLNAHLANPEYIVPGMKIFIPVTNKTESMTHPYSENRPVKKEMTKKEGVKVQPIQPKQIVKPVQPKQIVQPQPQPQPIPQPPPMPAMPAMPAMPQMPQMPQMQPVQPVCPTHKPKPIQPYSLPFHMMPVPDIDMTPSPQGWRLVESTCIEAISEECESPEMPLPTPRPTPMTAPIAQEMSPMMEEPSPEMQPMYENPPMQQFAYLCSCMPQMHPCMHPQIHPWMHPHMHPHMHPQMHPYGGCPCSQLCYFPVESCPPYPQPYQAF